MLTNRSHGRRFDITKQPTGSIYKQARKNRVPGPGAYGSDVSPVKRRGPLYSMGGKLISGKFINDAEKLSAFTPGPGRYAPEDVNAVGRVNTVYKRTVGFNGENASHSPTYSFGRSATDRMDDTDFERHLHTQYYGKAAEKRNFGRHSPGPTAYKYKSSFGRSRRALHGVGVVAKAVVATPSYSFSTSSRFD